RVRRSAVRPARDGPARQGGGNLRMEPVSTILSLFFGGLGTLTGYVTGHHTFPLPLSPEEEQRLLQEMRAGSEEARNRLIEHNLRLVAHLVKKFENTGEESEDLISIGTIGLIKAVQTYDPSKNTRLATYAARCIENEILMHLRAPRKLRGGVMRIVPIGTGPGGDAEHLTPIGTGGLIKAVQTYDPSKNTRLATYAARCIENESLMHLRATRKLRGEVMLFDPIGTDKEGNEISLMDVLGSDGSE